MNAKATVIESSATAAAPGAPAAPQNALSNKRANPKRATPQRHKAHKRGKAKAAAPKKTAQLAPTQPLSALKGVEAPDARGPREGSKAAQVVSLLQRDKGATLAEIMERMGWQKHTVRGFIAGAIKKAGYVVESFRPQG